MNRIGISLLLILTTGLACFGEARYAGIIEMIEESECIAIVDITKIEKATLEKKFRTYGQKASGIVVQCLKGNVEGKIEIYGMENFICAQCKYEKGRSLVFLRKNEDTWCGSNWHLGIRPIKEGEIEWFRDRESLFDYKQIPVNEAIAEIQAILRENKSKEESQTENNPTLSKWEVLKMADNYATHKFIENKWGKNGLDLSCYPDREPEYNPEEKTWMIFYTREPNRWPGDHFTIIINDETNEITYIGGA